MNFHASCISSLVLSTGRACGPYSCLEWSDEGQLVIVTTDAIHVLTPRIGYDLGEHCLSTKTHTHTQLDARRELARYASLPEPTDEETTSAVVPSIVLGEAWYAAAWSPAGIGPLHRYVCWVRMRW